MREFISVMTMGDIFDRSFKVIGKTFVRNLIISAIILLPPFILFFIGGQLALSSVTDLIMQLDTPEFDAAAATPEFADVIARLVFPIILFIIGGMVAMVGAVWATMAVMDVSSSEMRGEPRSWQDALSNTFGRLLSGIGFQILLGLAASLVFTLPYLVMLGGIIAESTAVAVLGGLFMFGGVFILIYLYYRWVYGMNAITIEDAGVIEAFKRSAELVRNNWWRTFGIMFLLSMVAQFAISLVAMPLIFVGFIGPYIELISNISNNSEPSPEIIMSLFHGMLYGYLGGIAVAVIFTNVIQPVYITVMYYDARARLGEFDDEPSAPTPPDGPDDTLQLGDNWQNVSV